MRFLTQILLECFELPSIYHPFINISIHVILFTLFIMFSSKVSQLCLAVGVGVVTGVYIFKPLLKEYEQDTKGTWIPTTDPVREVYKKNE